MMATKSITRNNLIRFGIIGLVLFYIFITMFYMDLDTTIQLSYEWVKSMFDGKYASFYSNALNAGVVKEGAVYDVGIYAVFGVWGIPVWISNALFGCSVRAAASLLWFKILLVICLIICIKLICDIARRLDIYDEEMPYHLLSMIIFVVPVIAVAQYDIIPMVLILYAILCGMDQITNKTIALFSLAFIMKPFAVFIFAIYLLVKEKHLKQLIIYGVESIIPFVICKLIYAVNKTNDATNNSFFGSKFMKLINVRINDGHGQASVFFIILLLACLLAYCWNNQKTEMKGFILLTMIVWMAFCLFTPSYPYWVLYLCPFLVLSVAMINGRYSDIANILEIIAELLLFVILTVPFEWVFGGEETMSYLIFKNIYQSKESVASVYNVMSRFGINTYEPVIHATLLVACIGIVGLSYYSITHEEEKMDTDSKTKMILNWIRLAVLFGWSMLCTLLLLVAA